jgi:hypothetical protein
MIWKRRVADSWEASRCWKAVPRFCTASKLLRTPKARTARSTVRAGLGDERYGQPQNHQEAGPSGEMAQAVLQPCDRGLATLQHFRFAVQPLELAGRTRLSTEGQQVLDALEPIDQERVELGAQGDLPAAQTAGQTAYGQGHANPVEGQEAQGYEGQARIEPGQGGADGGADQDGDKQRGQDAQVDFLQPFDVADDAAQQIAGAKTR